MTEREDQGAQKLISEIRAKQSNTLWPDAMRNSSSVDAFLWKGSPDPTPVQRMGAWLFGIMFLFFGIAFVDIANKKHSPFELVLSLASFALGMRVCRNGFRRKATTNNQTDA